MAYSENTNQPDDWRSIETAPKDGTSVLLCDADEPRGAVFVIGYWGRELGYPSVSEPSWRVRWDESDFGGGYDATHWMPLPLPPRSGTRAGE